MINESGTVSVMRLGMETDILNENTLQFHLIHNKSHT
jgi:hypothetical protein